jgi:hypothetical protein
VKIEDDGHGSIELFLVKHVVDSVEDDSVRFLSRQRRTTPKAPKPAT